ncbi:MULTISPECIES: TspO/MBR family protein [Clostridium]|uniref:TspO/MBR family protein n=4 Tax=Clostridium TaxID=1485 RepID=A0A166TQE1_9CLOT|nr:MULTISPECIES: TspO/MBR family protein [Clostridium]ADK15600.1 putative tryptophan-rich sensory protein [Clostridium ljungdahlii DSM 13528]AGY74840.1 tryptophan-rich sensory protein [Clostridium autoethanogenum DSM 10061]ALU35017.1 TspO/MBR-related protein [Clostridium autoethanogenum DSM 10061]OAA86481.1 TspO/MBR family protein [Clostridium ljungdahlii DSM 13528]OAA93967.1 TspO/MBR family protein [Clostridium coskatii]
MFCNIFKVNGEKHIGKLIISIIIAEGVGAISAFLGMSNQEMYSQLVKPVFSPPGWIFPIVWIILFFLMGTAAYRIWIRGKQGEDVKRALVLYVIQLALNFMWTIIFFRFQLYGLAFLELMILLVFILMTTFEFSKIDKTAAYLMIPYILWVSFAGILNYAIWMLNK